MVKVKADPLNNQDSKELCYSVLTDVQKSEFEKNLELDFSFGIKDIARFRGNLFYQRGGIGGVFRRIPLTIPTFDSLGLPQVIKKVIRRPNGLVLVTGPTGSGKSTSLAALLDILNREEYGHIMTIEDPIEFVHHHKNCVVNQREVGVDTRNFASALKRVLRQDPDFILVGELRDIETIEMALTMAETGHLVFGTLHTNSAAQSINRIINVFPTHQQPQIWQVLSFTLQAILSQQLIPKSYELGRCLATELLIPNMAIRNLIREDKLHQIYSMMQAGQEDTGMQTMNQSLMSLVKQGILSKNDAFEYSHMPDEIAKLLTGVRERK
jgi:twitching motility protein PilT